MRIGLALPQYDYSVPGESPLRFETIVAHAQHAEAWGYDSLWLSDHLFLDVAKYGGPPTRYGAFEPLATLAALASHVSRPRLGTLVLCEALRPPVTLAKTLATLDRVCGGRLDVGLGAGWYEPEYAAIGLPFPSPGVRVTRLKEATEIVGGLLGGEPVTYRRTTCRRTGPSSTRRPSRPRGPRCSSGARATASSAPRSTSPTAGTPAGSGRRGSTAAPRRRGAACEDAGRDPDQFWRSLGLYALVGEDERDLARRFERLRAATPAGVLDGVTLDEWRTGGSSARSSRCGSSRPSGPSWASRRSSSVPARCPSRSGRSTTSSCSPPP